MEELKKIKKSNIRIIIAIILVILSSISIILTYNTYLEEERERVRRSHTTHNEVEYFNSKFAYLAGKNQSAAMVKALCKNVMTNNDYYANEASKQIFIKEGDISQLYTREQWKNSGAYYRAEDIAKLRDKIFSTDRYCIEIYYENTTGLVMGIGITKIKNNDTRNNNKADEK